MLRNSHIHFCESCKWNLLGNLLAGFSKSARHDMLAKKIRSFAAMVVQAIFGIARLECLHCKTYAGNIVNQSVQVILPLLLLVFGYLYTL